MQKIPNGILHRNIKKRFTSLKKKFKIDFDSSFNFFILKENQKVFEMVLSFLEYYYNSQTVTLIFVSIPKKEVLLNESKKILTCTTPDVTFLVEEECENNEIFVWVTMIY